MREKILAKIADGDYSITGAYMKAGTLRADVKFDIDGELVVQYAEFDLFEPEGDITLKDFLSQMQANMAKAITRGMELSEQLAKEDAE